MSELARMLTTALHGGLRLKQAGAMIVVFLGLTYVVREALRARPGDPESARSPRRG